MGRAVNAAGSSRTVPTQRPISSSVCVCDRGGADIQSPEPKMQNGGGQH